MSLGRQIAFSPVCASHGIHQPGGHRSYGMNWRSILKMDGLCPFVALQRNKTGPFGYSLALVLIQNRTGGIFLAHMIVWVQPWEEEVATGRDLPPAHCAWGSLTRTTGQLQEKQMGRKQPVRSSFSWTESHFFLLHYISAAWDELGGITSACYVFLSRCHCHWCSLAQNNFLCNVWCWCFQPTKETAGGIVHQHVHWPCSRSSGHLNVCYNLS